MSLKDRREFCHIMACEGVPLEAAERLMRNATTLHRLAEAQCNGDWPADNGERKVIACPRCGSLWVPSTIRRNRCPDCAAEDRVRADCNAYNLTPIFQGDPRGHVLMVKVPSGRTNDSGHTGICVPSGRR